MRTPLSSVPLSDPMSRTRQPAPSQVSLQWKRETEGSKSTTSLLEWVPMLQTGPSWTTTRGSRPASRRTSSVSLGTTSTIGCALRVPESRRSTVGGSSVKRAGGRRSMPPSMMPRRFSVRSCIGRVGVVAGGAAWLFGSASRTVSVSLRVSPCAAAGGPACPLAPFVLTPGAMRSLWVSKRASDQCRTQMHYRPERHRDRGDGATSPRARRVERDPRPRRGGPRPARHPREREPHEPRADGHRHRARRARSTRTSATAR